MSHQLKDNVAASQLFSHPKILFANSPGRTGLLVCGAKQKRMKFKDGHAALTWCERNQACLFYMPAEQIKN